MDEIYSKVVSVLENLPLTQSLDQNEHAILIHHLEIHHFAANEDIVKQGHSVSGLHIIVTGEAQVKLKMPGGMSKQVATLHKNDFFGDVVLIRGGLATATITAAKPMIAIVLTINIANALQLLYPEMYYKLLSAISFQICQRITSAIHSLSGRFDDFRAEIKRNPFHYESQILSEHLLKKHEIHFRLLESLKCFRYFKHDEIKALLFNLTMLQVDKNIVFAEHMNQIDGYFIVVQGAAGMISEKGFNVTKLTVLGAGSIVLHRYMPIAMPQYNHNFPATFITRENSIFFQLSEAKLQKIYEENRPLYYRFHFALAKQLVSQMVAITRQLVRFDLQSSQK